MKIRDYQKINGPDKLAKQKPKKGASSKTAPSGGSSAVGGEGRVTISSRASEFQGVKEKLDAVPEVRVEVVDELKGKIESGSYNVEGEKVADGIIKAAKLNKKT